MKKNSIASLLSIITLAICTTVGMIKHDTFEIVLAILIFEMFKWNNGQ